MAMTWKTAALWVLMLALFAPSVALAFPELPREPVIRPEPRIAAPVLLAPKIHRRLVDPKEHRKHEEKSDTPDTGDSDGGDDCTANPLRPVCSHVHGTPGQLLLLRHRLLLHRRLMKAPPPRAATPPNAAFTAPARRP